MPVVPPLPVQHFPSASSLSVRVAGSHRRVLSFPGCVTLVSHSMWTGTFHSLTPSLPHAPRFTEHLLSARLLREGSEETREMSA